MNWYDERRGALWRKYWRGNDGSNILRPNGFDEYPEEIYNLFLGLIDGNGEVIDLGCGNGLLLKHLICRSKYRLIPYGIDFIEESIQQARTIIHPDYSQNFWVANIKDCPLGREKYRFIIFDVYTVHPRDLPQTIEKVVRACKKNGKIIFYIYRDVLRILRIINLFKFRWIGWVGELLPREIREKSIRIDHKELSIAVYRKE